jgi:hypothetical protein
MAKILFLACLLGVNIGVIAQKETPKTKTEVTILFTQDSSNAQIYQLRCITNSADLFGTINFYNSKGVLILQLKEIEIPHAPGYHGIDISEFPKGMVKIEMFIDDVAYTKNFRL